MRWEDERYIRFYTRNSPDWLGMSWQARGLFGLLMREVDRAGILKLGKGGLKGVARVLQAPWDEIEPALQELLDDGCVKLGTDGTTLVIPNFIEAQETAQSDAARKRKSREAARAKVDIGSEANIPVTPGHEQSHAVTTGHSVPSVPSDPCRALPSVQKPKRELTSLWMTNRWRARTGVMVPNPSDIEAVVSMIREYATQAGEADECDLAERCLSAFLAEIGSWSVSRSATPALFISKWDDIQGRLIVKKVLANWQYRLGKMSEAERLNRRSRFLQQEVA